MSHEGKLLDTVGDYTIVDCAECRFAHLVPVPDVAALYETYYEETKPDYFRHAEEDRGWWDLVYHERLALLEAWLVRDSEAEPTLLDVGSGPGFFLLAARKRGWDARGLEPSPAARHYSSSKLGLPVVAGAFDAGCIENVGDNYHAINLGEVLEHVADPAACLRLAWQLLGVGGLLCVVVPNDYSILQGAAEHVLTPHLRARWWLAPPHHVNYFNVRSLHLLLRRCGFAVADVTTTFPMELFLLMGLNYVHDPTVGREAHAMRKRLELALEAAGLGDAKRQLYAEFAKRGVGRDIVMIARKQAVQAVS